jgi:hypothetical protein
MRHGIALSIVTFVLTLAGCQQTGWDHVPGAVVRPESRSPAVSDAAWRQEVMDAIDEWADLLAPLGCERPFLMSDDPVGDHPVRLIANDDWPRPGIDGVTFADEPTQPAGMIELRTGPEVNGERWRKDVLLHELGHALNLDHSDPINGESIMTPRFTTGGITDDDITAAACAMGCGPCGTTRDPYDGAP